MKFKISVITPSLNKARYIDTAIKSVIMQGYENFEHIIVDGGSTDGTIDILKKHKHLKWVSEPDRGQSDAMNKGFAISSGDIIVYLNADDYFNEGAFDAVVPYFLNGSQFVVGKIKIINDNNMIFINDPKTEFKDMLRWWDKDSYCKNPVGYFYRREVQENIGGFNIDSHHSMDYEFLLEASRRFRFEKIDYVLGVFRYIEGTKTKATMEPSYYGIKFDFCEKYLNELDSDFLKTYKNDRELYLNKKEVDEHFRTIISQLRKNHFFQAAGSFLKFFFNNPNRVIIRICEILLKN